MSYSSKYINVRTSVLTLLGLIVYAVVLVIYVGHVRSTVENSTYDYLSEVTKQGLRSIDTKIDDSKEILNALASYISINEELDFENIAQYLAEGSENNNFKRMGIIDLNGIAWLSDGYIMDFSDRNYFDRALTGETVIEEGLIDKVDNQPINVMATPIINNDGELAGVLFATMTNDLLAELLNITTFNGAGYSYICNRDGDIIVKPTGNRGYDNYNNIFELIDSDMAMENDMKKGVGGYISYDLNGARCLVNYEPLDTNGWFLFSVVPYSVVKSAVNKNIYLSAGLALMTFIIFGGLLFYILVVQYNAAKKLERTAYTDILTNIYNWNGFVARCKNLFRKYGDQKYAMVSLDIDKFKVINDIYGNDMADQILERLAEVIKDELNHNEAFCRYSADIFNMLIAYAEDKEIAERLRKINQRILISYPEHNINISCGVYKVSDRTMDIAILNDRANIAKMTVKGDRDRLYAFYSDKHREIMLQERNIEANMEKALQHHEFKVFLQPQISFETGRVVGAEALVRWIDDNGNMIMPNSFIPLFEKNGFIKKVDMYMFERVCGIMKELTEKYEMPERFRVAVNLSRNNLGNIYLVENLMEIADKYHVKPENIEIELTESAVFENIDMLLEVMMRLRKEGFKIAIDDFGSGYSSLNLLKDLEADILKLDKDFLNQAVNCVRGENIIRNIIAMAKDLKMITVAEGVETETQVEFLKKQKCDIAQGYYYYKPISIEEFGSVIDKEYRKK